MTEPKQLNGLSGRPAQRKARVRRRKIVSPTRGKPALTGLELRAMRFKLGLEQAELAELLGVSERVIRLYEHDKSTIDTRTLYAVRYVIQEAQEGRLWPGAQLPEVPSSVIRSWRYRLARWLLRGIKHSRLLHIG